MRNVALAVALLVAAPAVGQDVPPPPPPQQSPRWGSFQFSLNNYRPAIDQEFNNNPRPFADAFGGGRGLMFRADAGKSLFTSFGTLEVGVGAGYFEKYGHGVVSTTGQRGDSTAMKIIPLRATLTYRFDYFAQLYRIPIVPYGRAAIDRYQWWVLNGSGDTATSKGLDGKGATNGYSFTGGVALLLNFFDSGIGRDMDRDLGINDVYLFAEATKSYIKDFGSSSSWNLSDDKVTYSGGLLFVF